MTPEEIKKQWDKKNPPILDGEIIVECEGYWAEVPELTKEEIAKHEQWLVDRLKAVDYPFPSQKIHGILVDSMKSKKEG